MTNHKNISEHKVLNKHQKRAENKKSSRKTRKTKSHDEKQKQKKQTLSIIIVLLMVASMFGIWASTQSANSNLKYNDWKFKIGPNPNNPDQQVAITKVNDKEVYFYSLPQDALNIATEGNISAVLKGAQYIIISSNPEEQTAPYYDLIRYELSQFSTKQIYGATTIETTKTTLPVLTCANATATNPVIELTTANNETKIIAENNCIKVESTIQDFQMARDRLLYSILGIINN